MRRVGYATTLLLLAAGVFLSKPRQTASEATANSCIAEVNVRTEVELACIVPSAVGANYRIDLWAKLGDENFSGGKGNNLWDWQPCTVGGQGQCKNVPVGISPATVIRQSGNTQAVQVRIVPYSNAGTLRVRLSVSY